MNWKKKALIMRVCAAAPGGAQVYRLVQKQFGRLDDGYGKRLPILLGLSRWLKDAQKPILGATFFEVGTGHLPIVPVFFSLMGAGRFFTSDLHRRLEFSLLKGLLNRLVLDRESLEEQLLDFASDDVLRERFQLLERFKDSPEECLARMGIVYEAPGDAGRTGLPDASVDCHLSVTVLEHVTPNSIVSVMAEGLRILKDTGVALHLIDLSDHFQHQDASISRMHFLRYSAKQWQDIAGNEFAYTNRLRSSDFIEMFGSIGFIILRQESVLGSSDMLDGLSVDPTFSHYSQDVLCATEMKVLMEKGPRAQSL